MAKKIIRLSETDLGKLVIKSMIGADPSKFIENILSLGTTDKEKKEILKSINPDDLSKKAYDEFMSKLGGYNLPTDIEKNKIEDVKSDVKIKPKPTKSYIKKDLDYYEIDLNSKEGYDAYKKIADKYISTRPHNLLGINGRMLADGAKMAYNKYNRYVPVELALAQLTQEGGFVGNKKARPIKTKNPFNVGNVDSGSNIFHSSLQSGINRYYDLMAKSYLGRGKKMEDLLDNFVNRSGKRYASDPNYEEKIGSIANNIRNMAEPVYAYLNTDNSFLG